MSRRSDISGAWQGEYRGKPQVRVVTAVVDRTCVGTMRETPIVAYSTGGERTRYVTRASFLRWMRRTRAARPVKSRVLRLR